MSRFSRTSLAGPAQRPIGTDLSSGNGTRGAPMRERLGSGMLGHRGRGAFLPQDLQLVDDLRGGVA